MLSQKQGFKLKAPPLSFSAIIGLENWVDAFKLGLSLHPRSTLRPLVVELVVGIDEEPPDAMPQHSRAVGVQVDI